MINWKKRYAHRVLPWPFLPKEIEGHLELHHNGDIDYADLGDVVDAYRGIYHDTGMHKHMMFDEFLHGRHDNLHKRIETNHSHPNQASVLPQPNKPSQLRLHIHTQHRSSSQHLNDVLTDEELLWFHDEEHESENNNHTHLKTAEKVFPKYNEDDKNSYIHLHMHHGMPMSAIAEMHYMLTNEQSQMDESKRLKQLPNESPLDFVHRWVHEVRGGEWNLDGMGHHYDNHKHAHTLIPEPNSDNIKEFFRHLKIEHGFGDNLIEDPNFIKKYILSHEKIHNDPKAYPFLKNKNKSNHKHATKRTLPDVNEQNLTKHFALQHSWDTKNQISEFLADYENNHKFYSMTTEQLIEQPAFKKMLEKWHGEDHRQIHTEYLNHKHAHAKGIEINRPNTRRTLPDVSGSTEATRLHVMVEHGISEEMLNALADDPWHNVFPRKNNESDAEFIHRLDHYVTNNPAGGSRHIHIERKPGNIYTPDHKEYGNGSR